MNANKEAQEENCIIISLPQAFYELWGEILKIPTDEEHFNCQTLIEHFLFISTTRNVEIQEERSATQQGLSEMVHKRQVTMTVVKTWSCMVSALGIKMRVFAKYPLAENW